MRERNYCGHIAPTNEMGERALPTRTKWASARKIAQKLATGFFAYPRIILVKASEKVSGIELGRAHIYFLRGDRPIAHLYI